jgi:hypothetical protein
MGKPNKVCFPPFTFRKDKKTRAINDHPITKLVYFGIRDHSMKTEYIYALVLTYKQHQ